MHLGGNFNPDDQRFSACLISALTEVRQFQSDYWFRSCWDHWVIDVIHSNQTHRIGDADSFVRKAGSAVIYRPKTVYWEWQKAGHSQYESWIVFALGGCLERVFLSMVGRSGYCHFIDSDQEVTGHLRKISEYAFHRRQGFELLAQGELLQLLWRLMVSPQIGPQLRDVCSVESISHPGGLASRIEAFIRARIHQNLTVADLAKSVNQSVSVFAHAYVKETGETPYRAISRLKMEAAKRLLIDQCSSVKQAALQLGYSSESHFSRAFKRMEGVAPKLYVKTMQSKHLVSLERRSG
jgi:AraC-like DNA-binding protein